MPNRMVQMPDGSVVPFPDANWNSSPPTGSSGARPIVPTPASGLISNPNPAAAIASWGQSRTAPSQLSAAPAPAPNATDPALGTKLTIQALQQSPAANAALHLPPNWQQQATAAMGDVENRVHNTTTTAPLLDQFHYWLNQYHIQWPNSK